MKRLDVKATLNALVEFTLFHMVMSFGLQSLLFFIHASLSLWVFVVPFILWPFVQTKLLKKTLNLIEITLTYLTFGILLVLLFQYFKPFLEHSFDGNMYHGEAIIQLLKGWNPVYDTNVYLNSQGMVWIKLYPKFTWIYSAYLVQMFGLINAGMILNTLVALMTFVKTSLFVFKKNQNIWIAFLIGMVVFLNPIYLEQVHTFYVDATLGNLLILLILYNLEYIEDQQFNHLLWIGSLSMILINIKFTGFVFAGLIDAAAFIYLLLRNRKKALTYFIGGLFILIFGVVLFGFNPYMNNLILGRHIFFPLMGEDKWDIISYMILEPLIPLRSYERFFYSITYGEYFKNLSNFVSPGYLFYDQRIGGFGLHFFKLLILSSLILSATILRQFKTLKLAWILMFLMFSISVLVNYQNIWWARYAPQLWAVIGLALWASFTLKIPKFIKLILATSILFLVLQQSLDIYTLTVKRDKAITSQLRDIYASLENRDDLVIYIQGADHVFSVYEEYRAKENGLDIQTVLLEAPTEENTCYAMDIYWLCVLK